MSAANEIKNRLLRILDARLERPSGIWLHDTILEIRTRIVLVKDDASGEEMRSIVDTCQGLELGSDNVFSALRHACGE
jgi:hypothetical protein